MITQNIFKFSRQVPFSTTKRGLPWKFTRFVSSHYISVLCNCLCVWIVFYNSYSHPYFRFLLLLIEPSNEANSWNNNTFSGLRASSPWFPFNSLNWSTVETPFRWHFAVCLKWRICTYVFSTREHLFEDMTTWSICGAYLPCMQISNLSQFRSVVASSVLGVAFLRHY